MSHDDPTPLGHNDSPADSRLPEVPHPLLPPERLALPPAERSGTAWTPSILSSLSGILLVLICFMLIRLAVPGIVEEVQYALTRGRQRAQYELAKDGLNNVSLDTLSQAYQMVSQKVGPSVVHINVQSHLRGAAEKKAAKLFPMTGQGSGVIVDPKGYIVTNTHVLSDAEEVDVSISDGRVVLATIVGIDTLTDIAVLKVEADGLIAAEWGDSEELQVGALVWAVGSPFGLERSITSGILSAKNRAARAGNAHQDFLQTDAAVNPGNSGGPLVDARGRIVGINTAIYGEAYQGIGFAVPSSVVRETYERIRATGRVTRGWLGVQLTNVTREQAQAQGLPHIEGAAVERLASVPGIPSPAERAGLREGDIVVSWDGTPVRSSDGLTRMVGRTPVGKEVELVVLREGQQLRFRITVGERPPL